MNAAQSRVDGNGTLYVSVGAPVAVPAPTLDMIYRLQEELDKFPQEVYSIRNIFPPGMYLREIVLPKGKVVVGAVHRTEHASIISKGRVSVYTVEEGMQHLEGPYTFISKPGIKRVVYAHEDTTWTTIHPNPTDTQDLAELVGEITTSQYADLIECRAALEGL